MRWEDMNRIGSHTGGDLKTKSAPCQLHRFGQVRKSLFPPMCGDGMVKCYLEPHCPIWKLLSPMQLFKLNLKLNSVPQSF